MNGKKFLLVGGGGRESAFACRLAEDSVVHAVLGHKNPTIIDCVDSSGGRYLVGDANDPQVVLGFAKEIEVDYVFVSADEPLANGVVDILLANNIKAIGGTRAATRIEWDKIYSIQMVRETSPEFTPFFIVVRNADDVGAAIEEFKKRDLHVVVKPQGLTGGKGVKVMTEHLPNYQAAMNYALDLLRDRPQEHVLLVEKLHGIEFTIMGITDGEHLVVAPASYDYPFRFAGDLGAGTGGMGCFTNHEKKLPFMTAEDMHHCKLILQRIIGKMKDDKLFFNGVLNGGFFKTKDGIRFMEFNGRFGDPEGLNILTVLQGSFSALLEQIWHKELSEGKVSFLSESSVVKYLVAKEYPAASPECSSFYVDEAGVSRMGLRIFHGACVRDGDHYKTTKRSRVLAIAATSRAIEDAAAKIDQAIDKYVSGPLEYRRDIGSKEYLAKLMTKARAMAR